MCGHSHANHALAKIASCIPMTRLVEAKNKERRQSARSGTSTSRASKGSKDDALEWAMESHREDMERYFKMTEEG